MTMNIIIDEITGAYSQSIPIHGDKLEPNCIMTAWHCTTERKKKNNHNQEKIFR